MYLPAHFAESRPKVLQRLIDEHQREPFDLEAGPLLRAAVLTLADDDHLVLVTQHHIITDGWSLRILLAELARGDTAPDSPAWYGARWTDRDGGMWQEIDLALLAQDPGFLQVGV